MSRSLSPERIAIACSRHPWAVIGAWLLVLLLAFVSIGLFLGSALTTESDVTNNPESRQALDLLFETFPPEDTASEFVLVRSDRHQARDPAFRKKVRQIAGALRDTGVVARAGSLHGRTLDEPPEYGDVSADGDTVLIPVVLRSDDTDPLVDAVRAADDAEFDVYVTGVSTFESDFEQLSQEDLRTGELYFGLPAALIVLFLVFGAVVAGLVPIVMALVSIVVAMGLVALIGQQWEFSFFVFNMVAAMGLALGIDYSLFIVSRFREERFEGREKLGAIRTAGATASRAVLFSGIAFVLAMTGLLLVPDTIFRSLAGGAILVAIASVLAALTLLPALLGLLGDRVNALRIPVIGKRAAEGTHAEEGFWASVVYAVMRRPLWSLVVSVALLLAAAAPVLGMTSGFAGVSTFPDRFPSRAGFDVLEAEFPRTGLKPVDILFVRDPNSRRMTGALERLDGLLARDEAFGSLDVRTSSDGRISHGSVLLAVDPDSVAAYDAVRRLRADYVPRAFEGTDARVLVGGETAESVDYFDLTERWLPIVFAFVLGLSFVLLTVAFRSIVVPATAIAMNMLSVGCAYGLLVLVFQEGVGNGLLGLRQVETIEAWVPLFLFAVLFGLSMDYQVFLLSRIKERWDRTRDTPDAIAHGVASTGRLITGAALVIIAVFAGFASGDLVMFQQMGFGVGVALLVDATIVRLVLVPAAMRLLGDWNWYLPSWLRWLPDLAVEGHEAPRTAG